MARYYLIGGTEISLMPDLASCYFCGTIADSVTERPIADVPNAPPELERTILLCQGCGEKLDTILTPVFKQQSTKNHESPTDADTAVESAGKSRNEGGNAGMTWPEPTPQNQRQQNEPSTTESTRQRGKNDPDGYTADPLSDESATAANDRDQASDDEESTESTESTKKSTEELPDGTRQVLRLLRNREFPINRAEIEEVARSAYDFDHGECELVIDALIDHEILRETDGQLHPND